MELSDIYLLSVSPFSVSLKVEEGVDVFSGFEVSFVHSLCASVSVSVSV